MVGLAPGFIDTPYAGEDMDDAARRRVFDRHAIGVHGQAEDIAEVVRFLIAPEARLITGHTVIADAGITRRPW
jgi:NAD(P)-dependent dehydrogenase (short-subunit alcohol dehydrogenase family)